MIEIAIDLAPIAPEPEDIPAPAAPALLLVEIIGLVGDDEPVMAVAVAVTP